ncbi:MAG: ABC transporter substrate-binding protein [Chloroflexota bacterium]
MLKRLQKSALIAVWVAVCLVLSVLLYTPAVTHAQTASNMNVVVEDAPSDLDPASSYDENSNIPMRGLYEGLVALKGDSLNEVVPVLAESWDAPDNTVFTFKLRQGVKFHDGTAFNADAAKFGLARTITAKLGTDAILGTFITNPDKMIQVVDPFTLKITFDRPQPLFLVALAASYGTGLVSPTAVKAHAADDNGQTWLQTHEAGTGPYTLGTNGAMDSSAPIVLKQFQDYWQGWNGSHFSQITIKVVPESALRRRALERGEADAATVLLPDDLTKLAKSGNFDTDPNPTLRVDYIVMGDYGPLKDPRARQAMAYAFDYAAYNRAELGNLGRQPNGPFPNTLLGADPTTFTYTTDLKQAKQLLDAAGVAPGTELTFLAPTGRGDNAGVILQQQIEQLGLKLNIEKLDFDKFSEIFSGDMSADRPNFFLQSWWPDYDSPLNYSYPLFYSKSAGSGGQNAGYYANPTVDKLIESSQTVKTLDEMTNMFKTVQQVVTKDDPAGIYMAQSPDRTVVSKAVKGNVFNALYLGTFDFYAVSR